MSKLPTLLEMLQAGVHFGHQKSRWHPKMEPYLFGARNGVHVIDLDKTVVEMEKSLAFVRSLSAAGKTILFVGTKKQSKDIIKAAAESCGAPYIVERWIGGLLTNFDEVKRRLKKYHTMKDQIATGEIEKYVKKEQVKFKKDLAKMERYLLGIASLEKMPDALYIADMRTEKTALTEAERTHVTVVGVCDSNANPEKAQYIIPANDDAVNSIKLIAEVVASAVAEGKEEWEKNKLMMAKEKEKTDKANAVKNAAPKVERRALKIAESV